MPFFAPGQLVADRFRVVEPIGRGGMGRVYRARQLELDRDVALKVLDPGLAESRSARARFQREARVAAALSHPGAVRVYDYGEHEGRPFLSMELLRGPTLRERLHRESPLEAIDEAVRIAIQVAEVLVAAHRIGLVHRDLKPSNIFLERADDGALRAVVADFGLAFIQDRDDLGRLTRDGLVTGTPAYLSPEQALGREVTPAADVYSLGCTLYEMLTGSVPFSDESEAGVVTRHLFTLPPAPSAARPEPGGRAALPAVLDEVVLEMLAKRPEERVDPPGLVVALTDVLDVLSGRERARDASLLGARRQRMLPEGGGDLDGRTLQPHEAEAAMPTGAPRKIAVVGELSEAQALALAANGFEPLPRGCDDASVATDAIWAPGADLERLRRLAEHDLPLVTDTDPARPELLADLLRAGVDEVLPRPVRAEDLARRLDRAIRRYRGRRRVR